MSATLSTKTATTRARLLRGWALWAPIVLLESYLVFTVFIFFFGPVDWDIPSAPKLLTFLVVNYGGLWLGYRWGLKSARRLFRREMREPIPSVSLPPNLQKLILISMIFTIFSTTVRVLTIRGGVGPVIAAFLNPGEAYVQAQLIAQLAREGVAAPIEGYSWAFRLNTVLAVLNSLYFPIVLVCWRQMNSWYRILFFASVACTIIYSVGVGAQASIGFMVFSLLPVALYRIFVAPRIAKDHSAKLVPRQLSRDTRRTAFLVAISIAVLVITVAFFQLDRAESKGRDLVYDDALVSVFGSPTTRYFPSVGDSRVDYGVVMLCKYVSHGYEGLALSMELPFAWTYGLGWSRALQVIVHNYLGGPDVFEISYLARNEATSGWPALSWWSTIFPWIASDTTFYGTVLFMMLAGFILGRLWMNAVVTGNPFAFAVLAQMFILVFMLPANNALAQTLDALFSFVGVLIIYFVSRRHFLRRQTRSAISLRAIQQSGA